MSEKVMIDGCDVSGCDFYAKENLYSSYSGETQAYKGECGCSDDELCKNIKNCCYKKQGKQLQQAKAENEWLKEKNKIIFERLSAYEEDADVQIALFSDVKRYEKVLEEIREIANLIVNDEDKPSCVNDDNCPLNDGDGLDNHCDLSCPYILGKHIKDKINEVLKEGE